MDLLLRLHHSAWSTISAKHAAIRQGVHTAGYRYFKLSKKGSPAVKPATLSVHGVAQAPWDTSIATVKLDADHREGHDVENVSPCEEQEAQANLHRVATPPSQQW